MSQVGLKRSLEEAINIAKVIIENNDNRVVIERVRRDRKVRNVSSGFVDNGHNELLNDDWSDQADIESLKNRIGALEKDIDFVLQRNEELARYKVLLEEKSQEDEEKRVNLSENNASILYKLAFYELITGLKVSSKDFKSFVCTLKNSINRTGVKFEINVNMSDVSDDLDSSVLNMQCKPLANSSLLPDYMRAEISCNHKMAPVMLGDAIQLLYDDKETEE